MLENPNNRAPTAIKKNGLLIHSAADESQNHYAEWKMSEKKRTTLYNSIDIKLQKLQTKL